jgi:hypothetical protein
MIVKKMKFQRINSGKAMLRITNEIKEVMYKHLIEFKEDTNEQLSELKENSKN